MEKPNFPVRFPGKKRMLFLTGKLAYHVLQKKIVRELTHIDNLEIVIKEVPNNLFGETVTVSGLLAGKDINEIIEKQGKTYDLIVLPPDCINDDNLFRHVLQSFPLSPDAGGEQKGVTFKPDGVRDYGNPYRGPTGPHYRRSLAALNHARRGMRQPETDRQSHSILELPGMRYDEWTNRNTRDSR